jgi:hypothetical protein
MMKAACVTLFAALAVVGLAQPAEAGPTWALVDTLNVPATGETVTSNVTLQTGFSYLIAAAGTFSAGANITADAEYSSGPTSYVWQDPVEGYESYGEGLLDLRVDGAFVDWGPFNANHIYTLAVVGAGNKVGFDIYDIYSSNNTGALTVDIYQYVPAPGALILGGIGAAVVGGLRRRRAI